MHELRKNYVCCPPFMYLLVSAAKTGKIINIKKGQFCKLHY
jgi:3-deoxy-D-manno-octulosonic acid (KDO) 8-phosphate synthase